MTISSETNVLFIPYRPSYPSKQFSSDGSGISQQKHAAREYHRRAKLQRLANKTGATHKRQKSTKLESHSAKTDSASCTANVRKNTFLKGIEADSTRAVIEPGAGQWDPFHVCVPEGVPNYVLEMLDHAISYQWPIFSSSKTEVAVGNIKSAVLKCAMSSPASFYTIIFAGATHNAFSYVGGAIPKENTTLRLAFKTQAIKALGEEISSLKGDPSDELLLAIITLGVHGSGESLTPPEKPAKPLSPLAKAQNFQYYGSMRWETAHIEAVRHMVKQQGGLHRLRMPGLANAIALGDIFLNFQKLGPPSYPLMAPSSFVMSTWPYPKLEAVRPALQKLAAGFRDLPGNFAADPLFQTIASIREVTIGYDNYLRDVSPRPSLERILWARNSLQHDLISLPDRSLEGMTHESWLYELCRLGTMSYMLIVLFPVPRIAGMHPRLAERLLATINNCILLGMWDECPGLLLWAAILGAIVSHGTAGLRRLYVGLSTRFPVKHEANAWSLVKDVCASFLWLDQECDEEGKGYWNDVCYGVKE